MVDDRPGRTILRMGSREQCAAMSRYPRAKKNDGGLRPSANVSWAKNAVIEKSDNTSTEKDK